MDLTPLARLFLALAAVLLVCRILSMVFTRLRQPVVVAEMCAGIALGPSLLGTLLPAASHTFVAPDVRPVLAILGQLGVCLYMFLVGMDFSKTLSKRLLVNSAVVSIPGIVLPLFLGFGTAVLVGVENRITAIFIGLVLAITALPVLARIIEERGLRGSKVASIALAAGLVDDVLAWLLLALLMAVGVGNGHGPLATLAGLAVFALVLVFVVRPLLRRIRTPAGLSVVAALVFGAAAVTDVLGLHLVIGAFAMGLVFPASEAMQELKRVSVVLLLPFYFVYTGLSVDLRVLADPRQLAVTGAFLVVAVAGKVIAGTLATRMTGEGWRAAVQVGVLMNARGLMQLVALDIGLRSGLISQTLYSELVVVAVITTLLTGPLLGLVERVSPQRQPAAAAR
ncbi:cation:proton antiporter [Lentzea sp. NBRC 105346]|uniref:cation:proton antiporter n=1 Tax=Lentzea sp. NBRC 105346 TaxID=3032205 RepID=UPI0024A0D71A|nr:cation:proton antiporter [Lentzea sp. NBRC 105346]GLZ28515.1 cation:proton antiporter [Lentzea sp. NBRC 105346]